jgi:SAM-dependent methyltransferase
VLRRVLSPGEDAFGEVLADLLAGGRPVEVVARRIGLHLQERGHDVVGIDVSPLAVDVARRRGLADLRLGTLGSALRAGESFDTILLLGNNLGLLGGEEPGRRLLRRLHRAAAPGGRFLAGSYDPYDGASELAPRHPERNRARGRMGGLERLRVRYRQYATPWYDVLSASREEVALLAKGTGWVGVRFVGDGAGYVAELEKGVQRFALDAQADDAAGAVDLLDRLDRN